MPDARTSAGAAGAARCPICGKPTSEPVRPFCGKRCADVDLARWLNGAYVVAGGGDADEDGEERAAAAPAPGSSAPSEPVGKR